MSKPFLDRLVYDDLNLKILEENRQKIPGTTLFKATFLGRIWDMVKANWLMLVFCIPAVFWLVFSTALLQSNNTAFPYSGNVGIGYPIVDYAREMGMVENFKLTMQNALIMMPMIIVGFVGLSGVFNVIKYYCWGMKVKLLKTFFRGIKNSFAPFIIMGTLVAACYVLLVFATGIYYIPTVAKVFLIIGAALITVIVLFFCLFVCTQGAMLNIPITSMFKNGFLLGIRFFTRNLIILIAGLLSMGVGVLAFVLQSDNMVLTILQFILMMLFFMMAFSWTACVWTLWAHKLFSTVYDAKMNRDKADIATSSVTVENKPQPQAKKLASKKVPYHNPKKRKK